MLVAGKFAGKGEGAVRIQAIKTVQAALMGRSMTVVVADPRELFTALIAFNG